MGTSAHALFFLAFCVGFACASHNWMETMWSDIGNRTLAQVTLPGTHDSGAYNLSATLEPGDSGDPVRGLVVYVAIHMTHPRMHDPVLQLLNDLIELAEELGIPINSIVITPWALAQNVTFLDQLMAGIRYIDFRAGWNGSDWHTFHFEAGTLCSVLIDDIATFLRTTAKEVVVIEVSHTSGVLCMGVRTADNCVTWGLAGGPVTEAAKVQLARLLNDSLGPYMLPFTSQLPTLNDMIQAGHRALVSFDDAGVNAAFPNLWPGYCVLCDSLMTHALL